MARLKAFCKKILKEIDPQAFVMLTDAREVIGEGFSAYTS